MKKIPLVIVAVAIACAFTGCSGTAVNTEPEGETAADTIKTHVDTTTIKTAAMSDTAFASEAAASSIAAVALSKLALTKSSNSKIKILASTVLDDHNNANSELKAIAKSKAFKLPTVLGTPYLAKRDSLKRLSGVTFDKAFVNSIIDGHQKILKLLQNESEHGKDADLKAFAVKTATTVQIRLDEIAEAYALMKK